MTKRELFARAAELGVAVSARATKAELERAVGLVEDGGPLELTVARRERALELVRADRSLGNVAALRAAGLSGTRGELRGLISNDFEEELREARGYGNTQLRNELFRRAVEGVEEPVFHQGEIVGHVRRYSDRLLGKMADAYLPEFRAVKQRLEITGAAGGPIEVEDRSASLADVARVLEAVGALAELRRGAAAAEVPADRVLLPAPGDD